MKGQLIVRIDADLKKRFQALSRREGKSMSEKVTGLIGEFVSSNDFSARVDRVWGKIGNELREKGLGPGEVYKAVAETRKPGGRPAKK